MEAYGAESPGPGSWEFDKTRNLLSPRLFSLSNAVLGEMIEDLGLAVSVSIKRTQRPDLWKEQTRLKVFICHKSEHKKQAHRLKQCLEHHPVSAFVAHDDIQPTLEWQVQIERALHTMDAFVSVHTTGFKDSIWTQQEIGFACARGIPIIPLKMAEDPVGFISKNQALPRAAKNAVTIAADIVELLKKDERTKTLLNTAQELADDDLPF